MNTNINMEFQGSSWSRNALNTTPYSWYIPTDFVEKTPKIETVRKIFVSGIFQQ